MGLQVVFFMQGSVDVSSASAYRAKRPISPTLEP